MNGYFYYIWFTLGFAFIGYQLIKLYPHVNKEQKHHYWLSFYIFNSESLDEIGKKIRVKINLATFILFIVPIVASRDLSNGL